MSYGRLAGFIPNKKETESLRRRLLSGLNAAERTYSVKSSNLDHVKAYLNMNMLEIASSAILDGLHGYVNKFVRMTPS